MSHQSQFSLLGKRRFLPFFITQSLGAFNDNIFKQSLILAILYKLNIDGDRTIWVNLCALLFILPFFLFSALAGQFGEKYAKDALIRLIKLGEIAIMLVGAAGFMLNHLWMMLLALFAMGTHSALFGPVKYSILPQALREEELVGGNDYTVRQGRPEQRPGSRDRPHVGHSALGNADAHGAGNRRDVRPDSRRGSAACSHSG